LNKISYPVIQFCLAQRVLPGTTENPPNELTSYRQIRFLRISSEVCEKFFIERLLPMVESNRLIPRHQFGFRQREQTNLILRRVNEVLGGKKKQYCSAEFLVISQAFNKVWHTGLLCKLK
jgi:hypothetical protein